MTQAKKFSIDELSLEAMEPKSSVPEMPSNVGRKCPKCGHVRAASENHIPAYACPACGVVYDKVEKLLAGQPNI